MRNGDLDFFKKEADHGIHLLTEQNLPKQDLNNLMEMAWEAIRDNDDRLNIDCYSVELRITWENPVVEEDEDED
jgi:hypothetical protein